METEQITGFELAEIALARNSITRLRDFLTLNKTRSSKVERRESSVITPTGSNSKLPSANETLQDYLARVDLEFQSELTDSAKKLTGKSTSRETENSVTELSQLNSSNQLDSTIFPAATKSPIVIQREGDYAFRRLQSAQNYKSLLKGAGKISNDYTKSVFVTKSIPEKENNEYAKTPFLSENLNEIKDRPQAKSDQSEPFKVKASCGERKDSPSGLHSKETISERFGDVDENSSSKNPQINKNKFEQLLNQDKQPITDVQSGTLNCQNFMQNTCENEQSSSKLPIRPEFSHQKSTDTVDFDCFNPYGLGTSDKTSDVVEGPDTGKITAVAQLNRKVDVSIAIYDQEPSPAINTKKISFQNKNHIKLSDSGKACDDSKDGINMDIQPCDSLSRGTIMHYKLNPYSNRTDDPLNPKMITSLNDQEPCCSKSLDSNSNRIACSKSDSPWKTETPKDRINQFHFPSDKVEKELPNFIRDRYLNQLSDEDNLISYKDAISAVFEISHWPNSSKNLNIQRNISLSERGKRQIKLPKRFHDEDCPCCHTPTKEKLRSPQSYISKINSHLSSGFILDSPPKSPNNNICKACKGSLEPRKDSQIPREIRLCSVCCEMVEHYYEEPWKYVHLRCEAGGECGLCWNCKFWTCVGIAKDGFRRLQRKRMRPCGTQTEEVTDSCDNSDTSRAKRRKSAPASHKEGRVRFCLRRSLNPQPLTSLSALPDEDKLAVKMAQDKAWEDEIPVYEKTPQSNQPSKHSTRPSLKTKQGEPTWTDRRKESPQKLAKRSSKPAKIPFQIPKISRVDNFDKISGIDMGTTEENWDCTISEAIALSLLVESSLEQSDVESEQTAGSEANRIKSHQCPVLKIERLTPL